MNGIIAGFFVRPLKNSRGPKLKKMEIFRHFCGANRKKSQKIYMIYLKCIEI